MSRDNCICRFGSLIIVLALLLTVGLSFIFSDRDAYADRDHWSGCYNMGDPDVVIIQFGVFQRQIGETITATVTYNKSEIYIDPPEGVTIVSGGDGSDFVTFSFQVTNSNQTILLTARGTNISDMQITSSSLTSSAAPSSTTTRRTNATTRPTQLTTSATTRQTQATTAATTRQTSAASSVITTTAASATTAATTAATTTAQTTTAQTTAVTAAETSAAQTTASETTVTETIVPSESAEETVQTEETSESVPVIPVVGVVDDDSAQASDSSDAEGGASDEATPTPTPAVVAGYIRRSADDEAKGNGFPWWLSLLVLLIAACGYRYYDLSHKQNKSGKELVFAFIPGGLIGDIARKIHPEPSTSAIPASAEQPVVVNGYLQKSNTASVRPVYSNVPAGRASAAASARPAADRRPLAASNRPISAGSRPAAVASKPVSKAASKPVSSVPLEQRPPIKRPKNLSCNAAAVAATAGAGTTGTNNISNNKAKTTAPGQADTGAKDSMQKTDFAKDAELMAAAVKSIEARLMEASKHIPDIPAVDVKQPPVKRPSGSVNNTGNKAASAVAAAAVVKKQNENKQEDKNMNPDTPSPFRRTPVTAPSDVASSEKQTASAPQAVNRPSPFARRAGGTGVTIGSGSPAAAQSAAQPASRTEAPAAQKQEASSPAASDRAAARKRPAPQSVPGSILNVDAAPSVASDAYSKAIREREYAPAIATMVAPDAIEKKPVVEDKPSPFKPLSQSEMDSISRSASVDGSSRLVEPEDMRHSGPGISRFTDLPEIKKPESPFKAPPSVQNQTPAQEKEQSPFKPSGSTRESFRDSINTEPPKSAGGFFGRFKR